MPRPIILCVMSIALSIGLTGCVATKVVTTTVGVATKATVLTVKTTGKAAKGTAGLLIPDADDDGKETGSDAEVEARE